MKKVFIPLTVGGGVLSVDDVRRLLNAGADKVSFNSAAVARPELIREASDKYGAQCIVVAIDAKAKASGDGWEVYTHGGRKPTGLDAVAWARQMAEFGAQFGTHMSVAAGEKGYDGSLISTTDLLSDAYSFFETDIGAFGGGSLQGSALTPRDDLNAAVFGKAATPKDILFGGKLPPRKGAAKDSGQVARMAITLDGVRRLAAIRDDWVQGFALAATSHDIGTAQAFFA